jgi:protein TonB
MRVLVFILLTLAALPRIARAGDAEGCADLKLLPRLEGCIIQECSAKQHDSFDAGDATPLDANTNSLFYSCPVRDLQKMEHDFDTQLRKAGYQNINLDASSPASPALTARKGSQWVHWNANSEDGAVTYSLAVATGAGEKFKAEACAQPPMFSPLKQCEVEECNSKAEDSVAMRTAQKAETSLTGNVQTLVLACPSLSAAQAFSAAEGELRTAGFEILFSDRERPENAWVTGRAGKRWVELASVPDGESIAYALTVVPSAEVLTAATVTPEPKAVVPEPKAAAPTPEPIPQPVSAPVPVPALASAEVIPPPRAPEPALAPQPSSGPAPINGRGFVPPKPILEVPIEPTHDRIYSVVGDVVINLLVDIDEDGAVTQAVLTGHISKDALKLESAAIAAVSHWRFEPARQDGRIVPAVKINVQMHFHGRPWRY